MTSICFRIKRLSLPKIYEFMKVSFYVHFSDNHQSISIPVEKLRKSKVWIYNNLNTRMHAQFFLQAQTDNKVSIISTLSLPLSWFYPNTVIEEWFPFKSLIPGQTAPWILLEIHLRDHPANPFQAPRGYLLVRPAWSVPPQLIDPSENIPNPRNLNEVNSAFFYPKQIQNRNSIPKQTQTVVYPGYNQQMIPPMYKNQPPHPMYQRPMTGPTQQRQVNQTNYPYVNQKYYPQYPEI